MAKQATAKVDQTALSALTASPRVHAAMSAHFWTAQASETMALLVDSLRYEAAGGKSPTDARLRLAEAVRQLQTAAGYMKQIGGK